MRHDDIYESIELTEDLLNRIKEAELCETAIILKTWDIMLGPDKSMSITIEQGNQYIYIKEHDFNNYKIINDLVCVFNGDKHGRLTLHYLQNLYNVLSHGEELELKEGE